MANHIFRLFILGAGFSKPAGYPLGDDLLSDVRERVRTQFQRHGWDGPLEEEIEEWTDLYPGKPLALEAVLAYSHRKHFLKVRGSDEYFEHGSRTIVASRQAIQEILIEYPKVEPPPLYCEFVKQLTPYDTLLTFNYDTLLEETFDLLDKPFSLTPEWWLCKEDENNSTSFKPKRYVDIIKLHGSIDWYDRYYHDDTREFHKKYNSFLDVPDRDPIFSPTPLIPTESLARGKVEGELGHGLINRIFRVPNHREHFPTIRKSVSGIVPFLLPPAYDKILGHDPIRELWQNMHRTLDAYSVIIVIGYSMPIYDGYAYEALGHLISTYQFGGENTWFEQRRVPVQLITLSPSVSDALENIPFLNPDKTRVWHKGFNSSCLEWLDWGN